MRILAWRRRRRLRRRRRRSGAAAAAQLAINPLEALLALFALVEATPRISFGIILLRLIPRFWEAAAQRSIRSQSQLFRSLCCRFIGIAICWPLAWRAAGGVSFLFQLTFLKPPAFLVRIAARPICVICAAFAGVAHWLERLAANSACILHVGLDGRGLRARARTVLLGTLGRFEGPSH